MSEPSVQELIARALAAPEDSDEQWEHVRALHGRGGRETFDAATALLGSSVTAERELGASVLAQLDVVPAVPGVQPSPTPKPFAARSVEALLAQLARESEPDVLASIAVALGHLDDPRAVGPLHALRAHPDEHVRGGVVFGLLGHDEDLAVDALIELSRDPASDVRDWASFGLGKGIERDTPQVREALAARLDDADEDTREEAMAGLAVRGDVRAIEPLLSLLEEFEGWMLDEALLGLAAKVDDPRIHEAVRRRTEEEPDSLGAQPDEGPAA